MPELLRYSLSRATHGLGDAHQSMIGGPITVLEVRHALFQLSTITDQLPELVIQLGCTLGRADATTFRDDRNGDPAITLLAAHAALLDVMTELAPVATGPIRARDLLCHLATVDTPEG